MTHLCVIPTCRTRNRHLPDCTDDTCTGCLPRTADEGHTCDHCTDRTRQRLHDIATHAPDARLVAAGLVKRGGGTSSGGKPGSRSPMNDGATDTLEEIRTALTNLTDHITAVRGLERPRPGLRDPIVIHATWLTTHLEWMRHAITPDGQPLAIDAWATIGDCAAKIRGLVNGPNEQRYLGPCGADVLACTVCQSTQPDHHANCEPDCPHQLEVPTTCDGDVYGPRGATKGRCRTCNTEHDQADRSAWLDGEVRQHAYRPAHIQDAYGVKANTIVKWHARGKLTAYWHTDAGLTVPWTDTDDQAELDSRGPKVFYLGDVLDLAGAEAVRRHNAQQKREHRARTTEDRLSA